MSKSIPLFIIFVIACSMAQANPETVRSSPSGPAKATIEDLLKRVSQRSQKLDFKWEQSLFRPHEYQTGGYSVDGLPLVYWTCGDMKSTNRALVLSAVHGDEVTPVYFGFRLIDWLKENPELCKDRYVVVAPLVNPDGFLRYSRGTRTNFNKVDVNRNFDTPDWAVNARRIWKEKYQAKKRYYPGEKANSEPETQFQKWLISEFNPTKILSIHAPLNILDYDGPTDDRAINFMQTYVESCEELKKAIKAATPDLRFFAFGNFPGSLGNYAGKRKGIPTITTELPTTNAHAAAKYFKMMEKGTRVFLDFHLKDSPTATTITSESAAGTKL